MGSLRGGACRGYTRRRRQFLRCRENEECEGENGDPFAHARAPSHRRGRRFEIGEQVERAGHENGLAERVRAADGASSGRPPPRRGRNAARPMSRELERVQRARVGRRGRDESAPQPGETAKHLVDVLVGEDRGADGVVGGGQARAEPGDAIGIVRPVADLAGAPLEPPGKRDVDRSPRSDGRANASAASRAPPTTTFPRGTSAISASSGSTTTVSSVWTTASFSVAISSTVSPRTSVCSSPTFVSRTTRERRTFVAS